ncbi:MAG: rhodanese-like domain-containing protein [Thioalkalispiraceae bacterium]|jgi:rhodanese-related sulfurtransferase
MENLASFISNNLFLVAALVVVLVMLFLNIFGARLRGYQAASPSQATQLINQQDALVLDIRQDNEYQAGHIINSKHIPLAFLNDRLADLEAYKNKPIITVCRSGHRSAQACSSLKKAGFESVYNLSGGVMAWESANLPLTKN